MEKKLLRIPHEGAVAGVCAGLGVYFGIDKTWVRLAFIVSVFFSGYMGIGLLGPVVYTILWIILPVKPFSLPQDSFDVDYRIDETEPYTYTSYSEKTSNERGTKDRYIAGLILLAIGIFFLLHQLDLFHWRDFARFWPILIILMGIASIVGAFNHKPRACWNDMEKGKDDETEKPTADRGHGHDEHSDTK